MASFKSTCSCFMRWIPCVFIIGIVFWSYYAYVVQVCIYTVESPVEKGLYLFFYHFFFFMFVWAYWQTIFTDVKEPGPEFTIPPEFYDRIVKAANEKDRQAALQELIKTLPVENRTVDGGIRYCDVTHSIKPDRCHHCSVVNKCVLKMDHYCPWVNNCVGFSNYKFFVLFLFYGFLYCMFVAGTVLQYFISFWKTLVDGGGKFHVLFLFFAAVMFAISLISLLGYHIFLVAKNRTTVETFRAPVFRHGSDKNGYNLGCKRNFEQVFGEKKCLWPVPVFTSLGDGQDFPTRLISPDVERSVGNGVSFPQRQRHTDQNNLLDEEAVAGNSTPAASHMSTVDEN